MRQLTLNVRPPIECRLDNFVAGDNAELLAALAQQLVRDDGSLLYIWGASGSGRSHLLMAAVAAAKPRTAKFLSPQTWQEGTSLTSDELLAIDDVQALSDDFQSDLFRILIGARNARASLIVVGNIPPNQLPLRADVSSRLAQGLIFEIKPLSDQQKAAALMQHAQNRGLDLGVEIVNYLLRHGRRDLSWLMAVLDALDEASLSLARPVTLPLLREILNTATTTANLVTTSEPKV